MTKPVFEEIFDLKGGRRNRESYILSQALIIGSNVCIFAIMKKFGNPEEAHKVTGTTMALSLLALAWMVFAIKAFIATNLQRLKDVDKSGAYSLLFILPIISTILQIYLSAARGTDGDNKHGPDPLKT